MDTSIDKREAGHYDRMMESPEYNFLGTHRLSRIAGDTYFRFLPDREFTGKVILDVCCGDGRHLRFAAYRNAQTAVGVDISHKSLLRAKNPRVLKVYSHTLGYFDIGLFQAKAQMLPIKDGVVDTCFLIRSFHHIQDKETVLSEIERVLVPGGRLIFVELNGSHPLRRMADTIGKRWGTLSKDEAALPLSVGRALLDKHCLRIKNVYYFNVVSEWCYQLASVCYRLWPSLAYMIGFLNIVFIPLDRIAENTILRLFPYLAWSYMLICRKSTDDVYNNSNLKIVKEEREDWNRNADFYAQEATSPLQKILHKQKLDTYQLSEDDRVVLDMGAGTGYFSSKLQEMGKQVIAIDFSINMLKMARRRYPSLTCVMADAKHMPFKSGVFDIVIADGILHHAKVQGSLAEVIFETRRVLDDEGSLCLFDRNGSWVSNVLLHLFIKTKSFLEQFRGCNWSSSATRNEVPFKEDDIGMIVAAGFRLVRRRYVSTLPLYLSIVLTNVLQYVFGISAASGVRNLAAPAAEVAEMRLGFRWLSVEQCARLKKCTKG